MGSRRAFVYRGLEIVAAISFGSVASAFDLKNKTHGLEILIQFPQNKSLADYVVERSQWIDFDAYSKFLKQVASSRQLLHQDEGYDSHRHAFRVQYSFKTAHMRDQFVKALQGHCGVRREIRENLGYVVDYIKS